MRQWASLIAAAGTLVGCAASYSPAIDARSMARVRLVSTFPESTWASALKRDCYERIDNAETMAFLPRPRLLGPQRESIGMPLEHLPSNAVFKERAIPAGSPIYIAFFANGIAGAAVAGAVASGAAGAGSATDLYCTTAIQFTPAAGGDYELSFDQADGRCTLSVSRIRVGTDRGIVRQPVRDAIALPSCSKKAG